MSLDTVPPWLLAVLALFLLVLVVVTGAVIALSVAVRGTSEAARPDIIRALAGYFRALLDALFRWRPRK